MGTLTLRNGTIVEIRPHESEPGVFELSITTKSWDPPNVVVTLTVPELNAIGSLAQYVGDIYFTQVFHR